MRKRTVPAQFRTVTAVLSVALLAAGCSRRSDTAGTADSAGVGSTAGTAGGAPSQTARVQAIVRDRAEALAGRRTGPVAAPAPEGVIAARSVGDDRTDRPSATSLGSPLPAIDPSGAMLVRQGRASVEVRQVDGAVAKVRQTAAQFGGFVANTSLVGGKEERRSATLEVRVPTAQFDALVSALAELGKVESVSAAAQDVGDEYVDLGARVANARRVEARLVEMLASRTGKLSEVLTVEQELRRVREEIERYDARLKWLERRTALSSLEITLHEPVSVLDQRGPSPIAEAFAEAWRRLIGVVAWCIASLGVLAPVGLLLGATLLLARRLLRPGTPPGVSGA
jgi:hypothetical protein